LLILKFLETVLHEIKVITCTCILTKICPSEGSNLNLLIVLNQAWYPFILLELLLLRVHFPLVFGKGADDKWTSNLISADDKWTSNLISADDKWTSNLISLNVIIVRL
jgi:hypothetical protein